MKLSRIVANLSVISIISIAPSVMGGTLWNSPAETCQDGDPACTPTGAHGPATTANPLAGHAAYGCQVCHKVGGRLEFSKTSTPTAYGTTLPAPAFDQPSQSCSSISCHAMRPGTFSYYFPGGDGEPVLNTVSYGGGTPAPTPSWYATGAVACTACHGNPPVNGSSGSNVWHSGYHANQGPTGPDNQCQFCHPDATSTTGQGTAITNPALHAQGTVDVQARFTSTCFNCH